MKAKKICILGGTGFVGRHLARRLADEGHHIKILSRSREDARSLLVLPSCTVVPANIYRDGVLEAELADMDVVVNLVGMLHSGRGKGASFTDAHEALPARVASVCNSLGIPRLLHMSALHADPDGPSDYLKSRGVGERAAFEHAGRTGITSFRPSVIFGPDDSFTNRFVDLLRMSPGFIPLACAKARFQPVYIEDVVSAFTHSMTNPATVGQSYDLVGPTEYSLHEIVAFISGVTGINQKIIRLGTGLSKLMAFFLQFVPGKPLAPDNVRSMSIDSVSSRGFPEIFGISPASMEMIVPAYLAPIPDRLDDYRSRPRRGRI